MYIDWKQNQRCIYQEWSSRNHLLFPVPLSFFSPYFPNSPFFLRVFASSRHPLARSYGLAHSRLLMYAISSASVPASQSVEVQIFSSHTQRMVLYMHSTLDPLVQRLEKEVARDEDEEISEGQITEKFILRGLDFYLRVIRSHEKVLRESDAIRFMIQKDFSSQVCLCLKYIDGIQRASQETVVIIQVRNDRVRETVFNFGHWITPGPFTEIGNPGEMVRSFFVN